MANTLKTDAATITGAAVMDVTLRLDDLITAALMVPMSRKGPIDPCCNWGLPLSIWGLPSTAKSDKVKQAGDRTALTVATIYPSQNQPEDFGDLPVVLRMAKPFENGYMDTIGQVTLLSQVKELNALGKGILFVDEGSTAPPSVQAAMLSMVLERKIGSTPIAPRVRILSAANPPEHAVGGYPYEPAFANRMGHVYVADPPPEQWWDYLVKDNVEHTVAIDNLEATLIANWPNSRPYAVSSVIGYTKANIDKIRQQPEKGHPQGSFGWASMRTWDMASKAIATAHALSFDEEIEQMLVAACVGEGVGIEWAAWKAAADLPTPLDVLTKGWEPDVDRLDRTLAVSSGITSFVLHQVDQQQKYNYATQAWNWFTKTIKDHGLGDIVAPQCQTLLTAGLGGTRSKSPDILKKAARPALIALDDMGLTQLVNV